MTHDASYLGEQELRERLARGGWSLSFVVERALTVEGRVYDVTHGVAWNGPLRGRFAILGTCVDGDAADRYGALSAGSLVSARRIGTTKLRAEVLDTTRARDELEQLADPLLAAKTFDAALAVVTRRAFTIEPERTAEMLYDGFSWQILARRPREHLYLDLRYRPWPEDSFGAVTIDERGAATLLRGGVAVCLEILSLDAAERILDVLASDGAGASAASE